MQEEYTFETPSGHVEPEEIQETPVEEPTEQNDDTPEEVEESSELEESPEEEPKTLSDVGRNLAALRKKAEQAERERDEAIQYIRQMNQYQQAQQPQQQQMQQPTPPVEEEINYSDDDLVEGKHLKRERARYNKELEGIRNELKQYKQQTSQSALENRLKAEYPDIEQVLTIENVQAFREVKPRLAQSLAYNPDPYAQAIETYEQIKALGMGAQKTYTAEKQRIQKNAAKPRTVASLSPQEGSIPLSQANAFANGLTPERKAELYQDMLKKARGG